MHQSRTDATEILRGSAMKAEGFVKPLIDLEGEILGCHIVGPDASNLIEEVVQRAFSGQFTRGGHDHYSSH